MIEKCTMKELPVSERPYEKFEKYGAEALSDAELLAVIIRTGTRQDTSVMVANRVLLHSSSYQGLEGLYHMERKELMQLKGIGRVKAIQLLAIAELSKRIAKTTVKAGTSFNCPNLIVEYFMEELRHLKREHVILMLLDSKAQMIRQVTLSIGTVNVSMLAPREIFLEAVKSEAVTFVLVHNHPSGDPTPSKEDIIITNRVRDVGSMIGIPLMDHIIIGDKRYTSFKESGYLL